MVLSCSESKDVGGVYDVVSQGEPAHKASRRETETTPCIQRSEFKAKTCLPRSWKDSEVKHRQQCQLQITVTFQREIKGRRGWATLCFFGHYNEISTFWRQSSYKEQKSTWAHNSRDFSSSLSDLTALGL